jgi:raffinose/stachyose/melibiose transport system permease protein
MGKAKRNTRALYFLLTFPALIIFIIFWLVPLIMGINYSFTDWNGLARSYKYTGMANYSSIFTLKRTLNSLLFTGKYTIILEILVMIISMGLTLLLTYVVSEAFKTPFRAIFFFPAVLSMITVSMTWNQIFYRVIPAIGHALNIGFLSKNILGNPDTAMWGIIIVNVWQGVAIPFVILLAGIQNVPRDQYEAAKIDGASSFQLFKKITVPYLIPTINVAFMMVLRAGINVFDYIQGMTAGGPMQSTESAGVLIYQMAFTSQKVSLASAYSVILLLIVAIVSISQQKFSNRFEVGQI